MGGIDNSASALTIQLGESFMRKIRDSAEKRKIRDYKIKIESGAIKGDNYLGVIAKVRIQGVDEKGEKVILNWLAKVAPESPVLKKVLNIENLYTREIYVYTRLLPFFAKFQEEKAVLKPFDSYAVYILSHMEENNESLLMEDMKSIGYIMKDRKKTLDYNHVKLVMEAYGKLHAISFALRDQQPEEFKKFAEETVEQLFTNVSQNKEILTRRQDAFQSKVISSLDSKEDGDAIKLFQKYAENYLHIIEKVIKETNEYSVVGHGDSWVNNMLFKYENNDHPDRPTKVCLLDWQLARYGSPAFDLSYFIFTCTDKELRDKHYDHMIKLYYHSLCQHLVDLGSDPEKLFPFSALQAELKRGSILGFHMSVMVMYLMMSEVDEIPDMHNLKDEDLSKGLDYKSVNDRLYQHRVRGLVLDFVKYGYFNF